MINQELQRLKPSDLDSKSSIDYIRKEVTPKTIMDAIETDKDTIVDAMPAAGKTHGAFDVSKQRKESVTYLTQREDLYWDAKNKCSKRGLNGKILPSISRTCPTYMGEHGQNWENTIQDLYGRGINAADLHRHLHLPCNPSCPYKEEWDDVRENDYDVLIGHYTHAHIDSVTEDRIVFLDEFDDSGFIRQKPQPEEHITNFLENHPKIPFSHYNDLLTNRRDEDRKRKAINWFVSNGVEEEAEEIISGNNKSHTIAGLLTASLLLMQPVPGDDQFESTYGVGIDVDGIPFVDGRDDILGNTICVLNNKNNEMWLLEPPEIENAKSVVGLDGTPNKMMWDMILDTDFEVKQVISTEQKDSYVHDVLGLNLYQPSFDGNAGTKPYNSPSNVSVEKDTKLIYGMGMKFGEEPALISTNKAINERYKPEGVLEYTSGIHKNYHQIRSSNDFNDEEVGVVSGCPHPGDDILGMWAALKAMPLDIHGSGTEKTYGFGQGIYRHFVHNYVLQAILRFSREDKEADVLVNTLATPDWLTSDDLELRMFSESKRKIRDFLLSSEGASQSELVEELELSQQTVSSVLSNFDDHNLTGIAGTDDNGNLRYSWDGE